MRTRTRLVLLLLAGASVLAGNTARAAAQAAKADTPVAQVRDQRSWEIAPFAMYGNGLGNRDQYKFVAAGVEFGKVLTPVLHAGFASGQFQLAANIMPLWQSYTPAPHDQLYNCHGSNGSTFPCNLPTGGGTYRGVSITPAIFRWNLLVHSRKWQPWVQAAGGLIYTTHQYPPNILSNPGLGVDGSTSVWNFSPQGGGGVHYFIRSGRSIDLGINAVHISSASLGDRNPGVNSSIQIQVGYTFWR